MALIQSHGWVEVDSSEGSWVLDQILPILEQFHLLGMFVLLLACGFGLPMPEDIILISGGILAQRENASLWPSFLVAYVGVIMGDSIMYFLGYRYGHRLLDTRFGRMMLPPARRVKVEKVFQKYGRWTVLGGRFAAGIRAGVFLTAGTMRVPYRIFFICDTIAALASVPLFILLGYKFSQNIDRLFELLEQGKVYVGIALALALLGYLIYRRVRKTAPPAHEAQATLPASEAAAAEVAPNKAATPIVRP